MPSSSNGPSDLALVRRVLAGEPSAVDAFVERMRCVPRILADRNRRMGGPLGRDDLRDLAQDVLSLVWQKLGTFLGEASLETWVWHFCVLTFLNRVRLVRRRSTAAVAAADQEPIEDRHAAEERLDPLDVDAVHEALERLPPAEAATIRAKQFGGATFEAIAARTGAPVNTVKSRYYRGLERMRATLEERFEGRAP